jgi:phage shock protein PspC (stress-responsive transcriptional regulator)
MAFFCQHCGNEIHFSARFCSNCGAAVATTKSMLGRPLVRPRAGRAIAGVCLALAQSNNWDVTLIRVLAVVLCLCTSGLFGVAYLIAWIAIPDETQPVPVGYPPEV